MLSVEEDASPLVISRIPNMSKSGFRHNYPYRVQLRGLTDEESEQVARYGVSD